MAATIVAEEGPNQDLPPDITCIIPARGRSDNLSHLTSTLLSMPVSIEILVIDTALDATEGNLEGSPPDKNSVRCLSLPAGSPGEARNAGLRMATGRWVIFVDDDDMVDPIEFRAALASGYFNRQSDVLSFGFQEERNAVLESKTRCTASPREILLASPLAFWRYAFHRDLLMQLSEAFPGGLVGEDIVFLFRVLALEPTIHSCNQAYYIYRRRPEGVSSARDERWTVIPHQLRLALDVCASKELQETWLEVWRRNIVSGLLSTPNDHKLAFLRETSSCLQSISSRKLQYRATTAVIRQLFSQAGRKVVQVTSR